MQRTVSSWILDVRIPCWPLLLLLSAARVDGQIETQSIARIGPEYVSTYGPRTGEGSAQLSFLQLVRQRSTGNQLPQCPCVHLPGSNKCIAYDSRYQAVSLEEAMLTFVDQSMDPRIYEQRTGGPITPASFVCGTQECRQCVGMLALRLRQVGLLRRTLSFPFPVPTADQIIPSACPRLRISRGINVADPTTFPNWAATAIAAAAGIRDEYSRRPRSIFARLVEQAINEARAAAGLPLISSIVRSVGSHSTGGGGRNQNQNNNGGPNTSGAGGRQTGGSSSGSGATGGGRNQQSGQGGGRGSQSAGNGGISVGVGSNQQGGGLSNGGGVQVGGGGRGSGGVRPGVGVGGQVIGESRPRPFPQSTPAIIGPRPQPFQPPRPEIPRPRPNFPRPNTTPNFNNGRDRFQQIINQGPPRVIQQPQQQFTPQPQFNQPQFTQQPTIQQPTFQQPTFQQPQTQFQPNWNGGQSQWSGQPQWSQQAGFNGQQQPFWNGQQQFGVQPQTVMNALGQAAQFIPNWNSGGGQFGGGQFGGNGAGNAGGNSGGNAGGNNGVGWGVGGTPPGAGSGGSGGSWSGGIGGSPGNGNGNNGIGWGVGGNPFGRKKRQSTAANTVVGERFVINCVEKGDAETESSDSLNLCTVCWTWRELPSNFFPRLINELVCQEDDYCLSGWGSCNQRYRNMDVLQKVDNDWRPTSISVASCCDCKVKAGSEAHALVVGGRKR